MSEIISYQDWRAMIQAISLCISLNETSSMNYFSLLCSKICIAKKWSMEVTKNDESLPPIIIDPK